MSSSAPSEGARGGRTVDVAADPHHEEALIGGKTVRGATPTLFALIALAAACDPPAPRLVPAPASASAPVATTEVSASALGPASSLPAASVSVDPSCAPSPPCTTFDQSRAKLLHPENGRVTLDTAGCLRLDLTQTLHAARYARCNYGASVRVTACKEGRIAADLEPPAHDRTSHGGTCRALPLAHGSTTIGPLAAGTWEIAVDPETSYDVWFLAAPQAGAPVPGVRKVPAGAASTPVRSMCFVRGDCRGAGLRSSAFVAIEPGGGLSCEEPEATPSCPALAGTVPIGEEAAFSPLCSLAVPHHWQPAGGGAPRSRARANLQQLVAKGAPCTGKPPGSRVMYQVWCDDYRADGTLSARLYYARLADGAGEHEWHQELDARGAKTRETTDCDAGHR